MLFILFQIRELRLEHFRYLALIAAAFEVLLYVLVMCYAKVFE